ncbi:glycerol-3-phosphate 1-O-acyltransferase PlsY [Aquabacterium sp. OR-4]|uniref:glycerol-3-phosphate 1-O-acyltransferase PlsY n=1 Tax=Aquabacterium sp. OR-4 TaxID=2978127 RepID=UPI003FCC8A4D
MEELRPHLDLIYSYALFFAAYLIGSLSFAVIVSRLMRLPDPRSYGSNNPGATNVLRSGSKKAAVLTLLLDALKGYVPTAVVSAYAADIGVVDATVAFVGVAAFLGHLYPVFFRFKGGKGVATALGVLLAYEPLLGLGTLIVWVVVAAMFRYSSLASLMASVFAPFFTMIFFDRPVVALAVTIMSLMLIWRHWRNIGNLMSGKESKLGAKADAAQPKRRRQRRRSRLHVETPPAPGSARGASAATGQSHSTSPSTSSSKGN